MRKTHYVYCTTNLINSRKYIGSHSGEINDSYLGSGVNITKAIKKYGKHNFIKDILWEGPQEFMRDMETFWCEYFDVGKNPLFYNCSEKGTGWMGGKPNPKLSEYRKKNYHPAWCKNQNKESNEILKGIAEKLKGKPSGMLGKTPWNKGLSGYSGWKWTDENREKMYWERKKIKCDYCGKEIGCNNIAVHIRKKHGDSKITDHGIGDKIRIALQKYHYLATSEKETIEAKSLREIAQKLGIDPGTATSKLQSGKQTLSGYKITRKKFDRSDPDQ
jgi:hypothetical protein